MKRGAERLAPDAAGSVRIDRADVVSVVARVTAAVPVLPDAIAVIQRVTEALWGSARTFRPVGATR